MHQIFLCVDAPTYSAGLKNSSSDALGCLQAHVFLHAHASEHPPMPGGFASLSLLLGPCFSGCAVCVSISVCVRG